MATTVVDTNRTGGHYHASPLCSKNIDAHQLNIHTNLGKLKDKKRKLSKQANDESKKKEPKPNDDQVWSKAWMKVKEVTNTQCKPQPESCSECSADEKSSEVIHQCLKRTLSGLNEKSDSKLSLVKINKATSQIVSGMKYTIAFDAVDKVSGRKYSSEAIILSQPWTSEDPAVVDFKCSPRASI